VIRSALRLFIYVYLSVTLKATINAGHINPAPRHNARCRHLVNKTGLHVDYSESLSSTVVTIEERHYFKIARVDTMHL